MTRITRFSPTRQHVGRPRRACPQDEESEQAQANRQTASLAGLAVLIALVVASLFLLQKLAAEGALEDCLMAGHRDCAVILAVR